MKSKIINKNLHTKNIITCDNVSIFFGKKNPKTLIEKFNYAFAKGKIYAIVGNSGVGKTTLVTHFNGLKKTKSGNIFVKDEMILENQRKIRNYRNIRKYVSLVFQFPETQIFKSTVLKDIAFGPINYHVDKAESYKIASKYSYLVGLDQKLLDVNPFILSNGQKRLVAIAGVLAINSDVVILDEPTAGLDPYYQEKIINIIKKLKAKGKTIIIISHNMDNVLALADEVLVLHNKGLCFRGKPYDLFTNSKLINKVDLPLPHIISTIKQLGQKNPKFNKLLKSQPRTLDELIKLLKKGGY